MKSKSGTSKLLLESGLVEIHFRYYPEEKQTKNSEGREDEVNILEVKIGDLAIEEPYLVFSHRQLEIWEFTIKSEIWDHPAYQRKRNPEIKE